jgi:uncharacterized membrane protein
MTIMILGLVIFLGIHLLPTRVVLRDSLQAKLGPLPYRGLFSIIALAGLYLIVVGKADAAFIAVWTPPPFFRHITMLLVLLAFIALVATYVPSNIKRILKHPMLVAVKLWALGHLLANGDVASIILFGSFLAYAVVDRISVKKRGQNPEIAKKPIYMDALVIVVGVVLYGVIAMNHMSLFGVPVIVR